MTFSAGDYVVPDDMSDYLAQRCIRSGIGKRVDDSLVGQGGPEVFVPKRGKAKGRAPENKLRAS